MKYFLLSLFITGALFSCKSHDAGGTANDANSSKAIDTAAAAPDTSAAAAAFFPVADFIGGQIRYVDSLQLPLTKTVTVDHKPVLSPLTDAEFKTLAAQFRYPDINDPALKPFYKESSYTDQSIASVVFTYTTANPALEIQKINVIVKTGQSGSDKVSTIYMEQQQQAGDTLISRKLYWKVNRNFQIITEKRINKTFLPVEQVKVVWDPTE